MAATFRRAAGVLDEILDGRAVLVPADGKQVITLNPVGTIVWQHLAELHDLEALVDAVHAAFPAVPVADIRADVTAFLGELTDARLVERTDT